MQREWTQSSDCRGSAAVLEPGGLAPALAPAAAWTPSCPLGDPSCHSHPQFQLSAPTPSFALAVLSSWDSLEDV